MTTPDGTATLTVTVLGPPSITSVSPDPVYRGGSLVIEGDELYAATAVSVGGVAATIVTLLDTRVVVLVDGTTLPGNRTVVITTPAGVATASVQVRPDPVPPSGPPAPSPSATPPAVFTSSRGGGCSLTSGASPTPVTPAAWPLLAVIVTLAGLGGRQRRRDGRRSGAGGDELTHGPEARLGEGRARAAPGTALGYRPRP